MSDKAHQMPGELAFKAGKIYNGQTPFNDFRIYFQSEISPNHTMTMDLLREHFQELLDLNVDDSIEKDYSIDPEPFNQDIPDESYSNPMESSELIIPSGGIRQGCAILIAIIITVLALIFFR